MKTKELAITKTTLEDIIKNAGNAIITTLEDGAVQTWNRRAVEVFGFSSDEMKGKSIGLLDTDKDLNSFSSIIEEVCESGELRQLELRKKTKDGRLVELIMTATPLYHAHKSLHSIVFVMDDFSERNRVITSLMQHEKLMASIGALNQLLVTLSHYINNSVMAINGMAQLTKMDPVYTERLIETSDNQAIKIKAVLSSLAELVKKLNLKTRDYVGQSDKLFDIQDEIQQFLESIRK